MLGSAVGTLSTTKAKVAAQQRGQRLGPAAEGHVHAIDSRAPAEELAR
jgi:hypothetical protein